MTVILQILAWIVVSLALVVVIASLYSVLKNPRGPKKFLRIYDACAGAYILIMYVMLSTSVIGIGDIAAMLGRVGFIVLLGLFIAEVVSEIGAKWIRPQ